MHTPVLEPPITSPNHFAQELGNLSTDQLEQITAILRTFMSEVRPFLPQSDPSSERPCGMCETCALEPSTHDWPAFTRTTYGFLRAVYRPALFMCHSNQPQWAESVITAPLVECRGFEYLLRTHRLVMFLAARKAMHDIAEVVPEADLLRRKPEQPQTKEAVA